MAEKKQRSPRKNYPPVQVGNVYGRLTVIEFDGFYPLKNNNHFYKRWLCKCECGKVVSVREELIKSNHTKSCGCYSREQTIKRSTTHGMNKTKEHRIWNAMKERCSTPSQKEYKDYGGRGIKVCDRWINSFENFLSDMGPCPEGYSIERIDVNGDYCPENCKWIPIAEQALNTKRTRYIEYNGEKKSVAQVAREVGLYYRTLYNRIFYYGFSVEEAVKPKIVKKYGNR